MFHLFANQYNMLRFIFYIGELFDMGAISQEDFGLDRWLSV